MITTELLNQISKQLNDVLKKETKTSLKIFLRKSKRNNIRKYLYKGK